MLEPQVQRNIDAAIAGVRAGAEHWARCSNVDRICVLEEIKDALSTNAAEWVTLTASHKGIPEGSPLTGEEWLSGPYAMMAACNGFISTLRDIDAAVVDVY